MATGLSLTGVISHKVTPAPGLRNAWRCATASHPAPKGQSAGAV